MATMMKEKPRQKKKPKDKSKHEKLLQSCLPEISPQKTAIPEAPKLPTETNVETKEIPTTSDIQETPDTTDNESKIASKNSENENERLTELTQEVNVKKEFNVGNEYRDLNIKLENLTIPSQCAPLTEVRTADLFHPDSYLKEGSREQNLQEHNVSTDDLKMESTVLTPSAPVFLEESPCQVQEVSKEAKKERIKCTPIEEAINMFAGEEFAMVKALSAKEEAIVETGVPETEHPLVDLLATFKSSLKAVERERTKLICGFDEEELSRSKLWVIEERTKKVSETCTCKAKVYAQATYNHATFLKDKLPTAKMILEGLLRDLTESYCHHQHEALLAYCEIEEFLSETVKSSNDEIRVALSLVFQALKLSDTAPPVLSKALLRWAKALTEALLQNGDIRNLLFLMHHLFRQTHSVKWASSFISLSADDNSSAAQVIALLDILLVPPNTALEPALECTEDIAETWEEVDKTGAGGAVTENTMREQDLLALLNAFPIKQLVARLFFITDEELTQGSKGQWTVFRGSREMLRACACVRTWLHVLARALARHVRYPRLRGALAELARVALTALSELHVRSKSMYFEERREKIEVELEATFTESLALFHESELHTMPTSLLADATAMEYCVCHALSMHAAIPKCVESLSLELPTMSCATRVTIVAHAAIQRTHDQQLARFVLDFLIQTGNQHKNEECKNGCDKEAKRCLAEFMAAHPYLYTTALYTIAQLNELDAVDPSLLSSLSLNAWRPLPEEVLPVLVDWGTRCIDLLQHLLLLLDYTPHTGLSLATQVSISSWLVSWADDAHPEWCWRVLCRTNTHCAAWGHAAEPPAPAAPPARPLALAHALLSTAWGHCIPLICTEGVSALCELATTRPREAVRCLGPIMLVMAHSPESVSLTPKFTELFTILLSARPTLLQRTFSRGGVSGSELLLRLILEQMDNHERYNVPRSSLLCVWLHALWRVSGALPVLLAPAMLCRDWNVMYDTAQALLETNSKELLSSAVSNVSTAPILCYSMLHAAHTRALGVHRYDALLQELATQRAARRRIHVDNALQAIEVKISSEELPIYLAGTAVFSAPPNNPAHLKLWSFFMQLYLQPLALYEDGRQLVVGPLFYSGLIKSRSLTLIKKQLQELINYHQNEAEKIKEIIQNTKQIVIEKAVSTPEEKDMFQELTLWNEESNSDSDIDSDIDNNRLSKNETESKKCEVNRNGLMEYHVGAYKMFSSFLRWLEDFDKVKCQPQRALVTEFIAEQYMNAAWLEATNTMQIPPPDIDSPLTPITPSNPAPRTPHPSGLDAIHSVQTRRTRRKKTILKSFRKDSDFNNRKLLLTVVDKHLETIKSLAVEWSADINKMRMLNLNLWKLVTTLYVSKPMSSIEKRCPNKCRYFKIPIKVDIWRLSTETANAIKENRKLSHKLVKKLSAPRPGAVYTSTALYSIVRHVDNADIATEVLERVWRCAEHCAGSGPAHSALLRTATHLAERCVSRSGKLCASLVTRWSKASRSSLQSALCVSLVAPSLCDTWTPLYRALLTAALPDYELFSALSKFKMDNLAQDLERSQRRDLLNALFEAAQRLGSTDECQMTVELIGIHTQALIDEVELCPHVVRCSQASVAGHYAVTQWPFVLRAVERLAHRLPLEQLSNLNEELRVTWWRARSLRRNNIKYNRYSKEMAKLHQLLVKAFVGVAVQLSYTPERVVECSWSALIRLWSPWIFPSSNDTVLLQDGDLHDMIKLFAQNILQIMHDCPGTETFLLQKVYKWTIEMESSTTNRGQYFVSADLGNILSVLPWRSHQWYGHHCVQLTCKCRASLRAMCEWVGAVTSRTQADTLLGGEESRVAALGDLLCLLTAADIRYSEQMLIECVKLPWSRLPYTALDAACDLFFKFHRSTEKPYHEQPSFKVLLSACGFNPHARHRDCRRAALVSHWSRAAVEPELGAHVTSHVAALLQNITRTESFIEDAELEELLSRALVTLCVEPAAASALPVWISYVSDCSMRAREACVRAVYSLTAFPYFAALSEAAIKAYLAHPESSGWSKLRLLWGGREATHEPRPLVCAGALHAAYLCAIRPAPHPAPARALHALTDTQHS